MHFIDVDDDFFDRLQRLAGLRVLAQQHLRTRHGELKTLAAHLLDQHAELQFAAAGDFHRILVVGLAHAQRHVAFRLAQQAVADHAAGHLVAFGAGERGIVDAERHRQRRRIDRLRRDRRLDRRIADRLADRGVRQAGDGDDVARFGLFDRHALEAAERQHLGDAAALDQLAVAIEHLHLSGSASREPDLMRPVRMRPR